MSHENISELVLKAKGNRSYREYQRDSGVDAAIISKIVKGTYIPKSPEIYRKLAACAENDVTFEDLVNAADYSKDYKDGLAAGAATTSALAALGVASMAMVPGVGVILAGLAGATGVLGASMIKGSGSLKTQNIEKAEEYISDIQRFSAISNGIIFSQLASNGIFFKQLTNEEFRILNNQLDTYLHIENQVYSDMIIRYLYFDKDNFIENTLIEQASKVIIQELIFLEPNPSRKVTIVTEKSEAYKFLKDKAGKLSYRGNLTLILIDTKNVTLAEECVLATFDDSVNSKQLKIL